MAQPFAWGNATIAVTGSSTALNFTLAISTVTSCSDFTFQVTAPDRPLYLVPIASDSGPASVRTGGMTTLSAFVGLPILSDPITLDSSVINGWKYSSSLNVSAGTQVQFFLFDGKTGNGVLMCTTTAINSANQDACAPSSTHAMPNLQPGVLPPPSLLVTPTPMTYPHRVAPSTTLYASSVSTSSSSVVNSTSWISLAVPDPSASSFSMEINSGTAPSTEHPTHLIIILCSVLGGAIICLFYSLYIWGQRKKERFNKKIVRASLYSTAPTFFTFSEFRPTKRISDRDSFSSVSSYSSIPSHTLLTLPTLPSPTHSAVYQSRSLSESDTESQRTLSLAPFTLTSRPWRYSSSFHCAGESNWGSPVSIKTSLVDPKGDQAETLSERAACRIKITRRLEPEAGTDIFHTRTLAAEARQTYSTGESFECAGISEPSRIPVESRISESPTALTGSETISSFECRGLSSTLPSRSTLPSHKGGNVSLQSWMTDPVMVRCRTAL